MNEWYQLVCSYKSEHNLTWPQLALQLSVNERGLREKNHQPPAKIIAKLRELLRDQSIPTELQRQPSIFMSENPKKAVDQTPSSKKTSVQEVKTEMSKESEQFTQNEGKNESQPPLSEDEAARLLVQHEFIRDPVHHDIWVTALERRIMDAFAFQRLRDLKQLGPTHLVYPGAVHTRFIHSIGTLHCAEQLVEIVNRNHAVYEKENLISIGAYPHLLIRICALIHDLAHIPFGHTLESEGHLQEGEWKDGKRVQLWLGDKSDKSVAKAMKEFLVRSGVPEARANRVVEDVRRYIVPVERKEQPDYPMDLEYPFVMDIVGNTLCADLLDYLERDMYFCGLRERSGDRVMKYLAILRVKRKSNSSEEYEEYEMTGDESVGRGRVVLLAYRVEKEHGPSGGQKIVQKSEILSEAIDLLRRRFALAEKVYFHRTKTAASAMLISAVGSASINWNDVYEISDNDFVAKLEADANLRTKHLMAAYKARRVYQPLFELRYREKREDDQQSLNLWDDWYPKYREPKWRKEHEEEIESLAALPPGSVAIYCPESGMNLKQFEMLVQNHPDGEVKYLKNILDPNRKQEMDTINERFSQLWKTLVFVDPKVMDVSILSDKVLDLNALCEKILGFPNDRRELQGRGRPLGDQLAHRVIIEYEMGHDEKVPHYMFDELVAASRRATGAALLEQYREHLKSLMESYKPQKSTR